MVRIPTWLTPVTIGIYIHEGQVQRVVRIEESWKPTKELTECVEDGFGSGR